MRSFWLAVESRHELLSFFVGAASAADAEETCESQCGSSGSIGFGDCVSQFCGMIDAVPAITEAEDVVS